MSEPDPFVIEQTIEAVLGGHVDAEKMALIEEGIRTYLRRRGSPLPRVEVDPDNGRILYRFSDRPAARPGMIQVTPLIYVHVDDDGHPVTLIDLTRSKWSRIAGASIPPAAKDPDG